MSIDDLVKLDNLWERTFPYLAAQIMESYQQDSGSVLELGPFSGGISLELAKLYSGLKITIADESAEVVEHIGKKISASGLEGIEVKRMDLSHLAFGDSQFDLVVFRGAFFFLDKMGSLLEEIFRVLREGGFAFLGGGHGKGVPREIINQIAPELRRLHRKLGGRQVSIAELAEMVGKSQVTNNCQIVEEGGVWLHIRK